SRGDALARRTQMAQGNGVDGLAEEAHMAVHEHDVAPTAVEAERLVVDAAVIRRPWASGRTSWRRGIVVDDAQTRIAEFGVRGTGHAVGAVGLGPAPAVTESRACG